MDDVVARERRPAHARFLARFAPLGFHLHPDTAKLMCGMVADGEVDHLVPERVWQELARGLMEAHPERMFEVLRACGALAVVLPEVERLWGVPQSAEHHPEVDTGLHLMLVLQQAGLIRLVGGGSVTSTPADVDAAGSRVKVVPISAQAPPGTSEQPSQLPPGASACGRSPFTRLCPMRRVTISPSG